MRKRDKNKNIQRANLLVEERHLESKGLLKEEAGLKVGIGLLLGLDDALKSRLETEEIKGIPEGEEMTRLARDKFHVTLVSIKAFKPFKNLFIDKDLSGIQIPNVELGHGKFVHRKDVGKVTYVLAVTNQDELKAFVDEIFASVGKENPEDDRFFHVTIANNAGGNPLDSIGSVVKQDLMEGEESSDIQVWFDLDGVLADFEASILNDKTLKELKGVLTSTIESGFPDYANLSNDEIKAKFKADLPLKKTNLTNIINEEFPEYANLNDDKIKEKLMADSNNPNLKRLKVAFHEYEEVKRLKKVFKNYNNYVFKIAGKKGFFANLELIDGGRDMIILAHKLTGVKPNILSAPIGNEKNPDNHSVIEKRAWVEEHFGDIVDHVEITTDKPRVINSERDILIDDRTKYVNAFRNAGGSAVLFKDAVSASKDLTDLVTTLK